MNKDNSIYLSKSLITKGLQCYKSLYLKRYYPELAEELSQDCQIRMETGRDIGVIARDLFPGGIEIPHKGLSLEQQIELTKEALQKYDTIYEAAFTHDSVFIKTDILRKSFSGWEIYEVKSSTEVKDYHIHDLTAQFYVIKNCGIPIENAYIVHINKDYIRQGEIEVEKLFTCHNLTDKVKENENYIKEEISKMRQILLNSDIPDIEIGKHCETPFTCEFISHCWSHIPQKGSVFELKGKGANPFELYKEGIIYLKDIPLDKLSEKQRIQVICELKKDNIIDREGLREFLSKLHYPLFFLDFETCLFAIPPYDGMSPYQHLPFQYSLHIKKNEKGPLEHYEYLAEPNSDPRRELVEKLLSEIPDNSCGFAYCAEFEKGRLKELAEWFPEYREKLIAIAENIIDLAEPFRERYFYHSDMKGSYSQKVVLPTLVPELSYEEMNISNGNMAMDAYIKMCKSKDIQEIERLRKSLLGYCKLDTLGMVKILEKLKELGK